MNKFKELLAKLKQKVLSFIEKTKNLFASVYVIEPDTLDKLDSTLSVPHYITAGSAGSSGGCGELQTCAVFDVAGSLRGKPIESGTLTYHFEKVSGQKPVNTSQRKKSKKKTKKTSKKKSKKK